MEIVASIVDITPTHPVVAGGFIDGREPLSKISERLEANLAVIREDSESDPIVMISLDLLYPGRILRAALESALPGLRADQIFLTASHTHRAPMTDDTKHLLGTPDAQYMDALTLSLSSELVRMIHSDEAQTGKIATATVSAKHSINRRLKRRFAVSRKPFATWFGVRYLMAPNKRGVTDELITILVSRSPAGRAQFVIWNYACHPVAFPDMNQIAADFPNQVRTVLRASLGVKDLPVLFFLGFSGNTRPSASVAKTTSLRSWTRRLLAGPCFTRMTWTSYVTWGTELGELVALGCSNSVPLEDNALSSTRRMFPTSSFVADAEEPEVSFHSIRLGPDFAVVGASAEMVAEFAPKVRDMAGSRRVMCVACLDHPFGYAPTREILLQGGYEGGDYCRTFNLGPLVPTIEDEMLQGFRSVLLR
jgi:hypothetical protein